MMDVMPRFDDDEVMALCKAAWHYNLPITDETEPELLRSLAYGGFLLDLRLRRLGREIIAPVERLARRLGVVREGV